MTNVRVEVGLRRAIGGAKEGETNGGITVCVCSF